jgi:hypothetical protein
VREVGILIAIQRNTIEILRKIPNAQITLSRITWELQFTPLYRRDISFRISPSGQKVFWKGGGDCY